jgi:tRNA pseudouridine55 synthase
MNGVVVIDKPSGKTSFDVVRDIKKVLQIKKVGHTGTLDPLATGVLPICINEATKLVRFFSEDDKEYRATMLLGVETDTLDTEGNIVSRKEPDVSRKDIEGAIKNFEGKIDQKPPKYSAIKFKGRPLYKWSREGIDIDPQPRKVEIYNITITDMASPFVTFDISCSKGTYIRSICSDIGKKLGCGACLSGLRRTRSGHFREDSAAYIDDMDDRSKRDILIEKLIPMKRALPGLRSVAIDNDIADMIRKGYQPDLEMFDGFDIALLAKGDNIKFVTKSEKVVAVARMLFSSEELFSLDGDKKRIAEILRVFNV